MHFSLDFQSDISTIEFKGNTTKVMSNKKSSKNSSSAKSSALNPGALNPSELQGLARVKWSSMTTDLKSAMGSWSDLDQKPAAKSPEEEQLDKVKSLIEDLKLKLNDF